MKAGRPEYPTKFIQLVVVNAVSLVALDDAGDVWLLDAPKAMRWVRLEAVRAVETTTTPAKPGEGTP